MIFLAPLTSAHTPNFFKNMGLLICPNLHRNSESEVGRIENVIEYRRRRDWRVQVNPLRRREIASPPITNSFFSGEGRPPDSPPNSFVRRSWKAFSKLRPKSWFSYIPHPTPPHFQTPGSVSHRPAPCLDVLEPGAHDHGTIFVCSFYCIGSFRFCT